MTTKEWLDDVAQSALCSRVTLGETYDAAARVIVNGVLGDLVECGVWAGANSAAMAKALMDCGMINVGCEVDAIPRALTMDTNRRVHLFDSFEGIPQAGDHDTEYLEAGHAAGLSACSIETTQQQMKAWGIPDELLVYHKGWFKDTVWLGVLPQTQIALLRLDGDLYESTKICLEYLYPLVSPGGIVIVDDWVLSGCRKACQEYFGPAGTPGPIYFTKESL